MSSTTPVLTPARTRALTALRTPEAVLMGTGLVVHAVNWMGSVLTGRLLGPRDFADLAVVTTLLMMIVVASDSVQMVSARAAARAVPPTDSSGLHGWIRSRALVTGLVGAALVVLASPVLATTFQMSSPLPLVLFAATVPLGLALGAERGRAQGALQLNRLATSNAAESGVRLVVALTLVLLGTGVVGATIAIPVAMATAWLPVRSRLSTSCQASATASREARRSGAIVTIALSAQVLLTQGDTLAVRAMVSPVQAGVFAAVALLGRGVFFATTTVVEVAFPHLARGDRAQAHAVTRRALAATATLGVAAVTLTAAVPHLLLTVPFGAEFASGEPLLWRYTLASSLCSLGWVAVSARIAQGDRHAARAMVVAAIAQTALVLLGAAHSLGRAIDVQILVMAAFAAFELRPFLRPAPTPRKAL